MESTYFTIVENVLTRNLTSSNRYIVEATEKKMRSVGSVNNIIEFNDLVANSLSIINSGIFFCPDFPDFVLPKKQDITEYNDGKMPDQVPDAIITWGVVRQEPGTVSGDPPFRGTREVKPRSREFLAILNQPSLNIFGDERIKHINEVPISLVNVTAQVFDNLVQYNIWAKSNREVEELTEWFVDYMSEYTGMFREAGINQMYFDRRIRDDTIVAMKSNYHVRSVIYYIRTEKVKVEKTAIIERIDVKISAEHLANISKVNPEPDLYDRIVNKWVNRS